MKNINKKESERLENIANNVSVGIMSVDAILEELSSRLYEQKTGEDAKTKKHLESMEEINLKEEFIQLMKSIKTVRSYTVVHNYDRLNVYLSKTVGALVQIKLNMDKASDLAKVFESQIQN